MNAIAGIPREWTDADRDAAKRLECWETPAWVPEAVFQVELFTHSICDPCCGRGVWGDVAVCHGYSVLETDLYDWGKPKSASYDFLAPDYPYDLAGTPHPSSQWSVVMNPPFSKACDFVRVALERGARKVACFQRWSWWAESRRRRKFFEQYPPARVWACGDRATSWLITVPESERVDSNGRPKSTPTAHAVFIFERGHGGAPQIGKIWDASKIRR